MKKWFEMDLHAKTIITTAVNLNSHSFKNSHT